MIHDNENPNSFGVQSEEERELQERLWKDIEKYKAALLQTRDLAWAYVPPPKKKQRVGNMYEQN